MIYVSTTNNPGIKGNMGNMLFDAAARIPLFGIKSISNGNKGIMGKKVQRSERKILIASFR